MTTPIPSLSGEALREMFAAATAWLERNVEQVNAINVFPVPDGDTGTNMYLTMRATMDEAKRCTDSGAGAMLAAMSHGALMGARGNSGVILSQIIRGAASALDGLGEVDASAFAGALEQGSAAAYRAVTKPVEGTILTVSKDAAAAARASANGRKADMIGLLESIVAAANESVARTPELLPVLAEAGVVDAGGKGLSVLLEGMLKYLKGEPLEAPAGATGAIEQEWLSVVEQRHEAEESVYGYCTEVLVEGQDIDVDAARKRMLDLGDSVLVVGDERLLRVHVHTDDPGAVLSHGTAAGSLVQVKVDNIGRQAERFVQMHEQRLAAPAEAEAISSVAVAAGDGMASIFQSMGCTRVVSGGPTMNPSAGEITEAIEVCGSDDVVVLPNDKNIILAAEQAAGQARKRVQVIPSRSIPQGIAALLCLNQEQDLETNAAAMAEALASVRTVEVTRAVRDVTLMGVKVRKGDVIAVVDDELKLTAASAQEAVVKALEGLVSGETSLVTLYYGAGTPEAEASALAERLRGSFAGHEVEVAYGGQPHYSYIVSLE